MNLVRCTTFSVLVSLKQDADQRSSWLYSAFCTLVTWYNCSAWLCCEEKDLSLGLYNRWQATRQIHCFICKKKSVKKIPLILWKTQPSELRAQVHRGVRNTLCCFVFIVSIFWVLLRKGPWALESDTGSKPYTTWSCVSMETCSPHI